MTEFDFDELDRAVNNLMSDVDTSKRSEGFDDPEEKTVVLADPQDQSVPAVPVSDPVVTAQPLSAKRRGRFMDVVRPSSDMNSSFPTKRPGMVVQPTVAAQDTDETSTPAVEPTVSNREVAQEENSYSDVYNIPDTNESQTPVIPETTEQPVSTDGSENAPTSGTQESHEPTEQRADLPMESPFLADAKVEKRPLGAPTELSEEGGSSYASEPGEPDVEPTQPVEETPAPVEAPQELTPEIMNIESNPIPQETPEQDVPSPAPAEAVAVVESPTPTDIVPQYTESETHDSEPSGAIYDTAAYHQPLEKPAKRHTGWGIVVWILLLLIVGAVAGAAYFYFTTQY